MTDNMRNEWLDHQRATGFKDFYANWNFDFVLKNWNLKDDMKKSIEKELKKRKK